MIAFLNFIEKFKTSLRSQNILHSISGMRQKNIDKKYQIFQNLQSNKNLFLKPQEKFEFFLNRNFLSKNLENECLNFENARKYF